MWPIQSAINITLPRTSWWEPCVLFVNLYKKQLLKVSEVEVIAVDSAYKRLIDSE